MRFTQLNDWLSWQESLNPAEIDLGLARISTVLQQAGLATTFNSPLITVAGTNGKGSVVAALESIAITSGLTVCSYTSPHIFKYNERIKINGEAIDDTRLCEAFAHIDEARGEAELTYFEFGTLAAIDIFHRQHADLVILEVGLGGRLDAVNIMDSDVSIITSIAIDHVDWLGDNREAIAYEKAGVFRANKPVICGESNPPASMVKRADSLQCEFLQLGRDYHVVNSESAEGMWSLKNGQRDITDLPKPSLLGEFQRSNVATALMALLTLDTKGLLPTTYDLYDKQQLSQALRHIVLPGRFQKLHDAPAVYVDVAHNPEAAKALAAQLKLSETQSQGRTWAIVAMLADKDIEAVLQNTQDEIDCWCFAGLPDVSRGLSVQALLESLSCSDLVQQNSELLSGASTKIQHDLVTNQCTILSDTISLSATVAIACKQVLSKAGKDDRIIIFGSFYTVKEAMQFFSDFNNDVMRLKN